MYRAILHDFHRLNLNNIARRNIRGLYAFCCFLLVQKGFGDKIFNIFDEDVEYNILYLNIKKMMLYGNIASFKSCCKYFNNSNRTRLARVIVQ